MGHLYHTPCPQGLEIIWEGKAEILQESEEINSRSKTVLSGYDNAVVHINSQRLWLHTQVLHKIKAAQIPAQMRLTKEIFSNIWLPGLGSAISFLSWMGSLRNCSCPKYVVLYLCTYRRHWVDSVGLNKKQEWVQRVGKKKDGKGKGETAGEERRVDS